LYGLSECPKGTKKIDRDKSDINNVTTIFSELDNSIKPSSIKDTVRLGKYNSSDRLRPLLVTLNRATEASIILSKRVQVKSPLIIKADFSKEARVIESHLLKARWSLIQANIPKSDIKIHAAKLYVKDKLHGQADTTGYTPLPATGTADIPVSPNAVTQAATSGSSNGAPSMDTRSATKEIKRPVNLHF